MQPCYVANCEMDGITDIFHPKYERTYPVCDKHRKSVPSSVEVNEVVDAA